MIISRGFNCVKFLTNSNSVLKSSLNNVISRSSGRWSYRSYNPATPTDNKIADAIGGCFWGWIIYHLINDYGHIIGEYSTPDPSLWTDEELGIPPDHVGPAK